MYDVVWGSQQTRPVTATGMSAAAAWQPEGDDYSRSQRQPVPLDAPDVALRGQRLMPYKERLRREEGRASQEIGRARPSNRQYRPSEERMGPAAGVMRPHTPLLVDRLADAEDLAPPRQREVEHELFREPRDAPEVGRRPLDMGVPCQPRRPDARPATPIPRQRQREMQFDDDPYGVPVGPRHTSRPAPLVQHRLAKLDVFKGEIGEKLDDFIFQVEEFATFHEWDPMETYRQPRTHLRGVALAYIRRTPLHPRDWTELKTLLTRRFQPRDLKAACKAQFRTRKRQRSEDIPTYVDALQKLAERAWPLLDPIA